MRLIAPVMLSALMLGSVSASSHQSAAPTLESLLRDAAAYLEQYGRDVASVIAQEEYEQRVDVDGRMSRRTLVAEFLVLSDQTGWVEFRDVFQVDGQRVRDRDERLVRLFADAGADARAQGRRIADESARFNLNAQNWRIPRTLNVPMTALRYLRREHQSRSAFQLGRVSKSVATVRFKEKETLPPLIGSNQSARAQGTFWIEVATGRVVKTDLTIKGDSLTANFIVDYADQPSLRLWLPSMMNEAYIIRATGLEGPDGPRIPYVSGHATYTNYRQFTVNTSTDVK
jgi:hypothetical protein